MSPKVRKENTQSPLRKISAISAVLGVLCEKPEFENKIENEFIHRIVNKL